MNPTARWNATWARLEPAPPDGLLDELLSAYAESHRAYHTMEHLDECFRHLDACPIAPYETGLLELAVWFHDAIYDTKAADNEAQSANWARRALSMLSADDLATVERMILVTKHDASPSSVDEKLLLDVDLSILGSDPARFAEYEVQIRREYSWVPEEAYRAARSRIMREFRARPVLYHTAWFREALEGPARSNLDASLASLAV